MLQKVAATNANSTDPKEVEWALHNARTVVQAMRWRSGERHRDRWMAEGLRWLKDHRFPGEKIVASAANVHIEDSEHRSGTFLKEWYGTKYLSMGLFSYRGRYRNWDYTTMKEGVEFDLPTPSSTHIAACLETAGPALMVVDMRDEQLPPCLAPQSGLFDLVLFVRTTTPSRWLARPQ